MLKKIVLGVGGLILAGIVIVLVLAAMKPDEFRVERSVEIAASPEKIFPLINDLHAFGTWSPYEKMDPDMQRYYSGAEAGEGAVYRWEGDGNAGAGQMTITQSVPDKLVAMSLEFTKPFEAHNNVEFTLEPQGDTTRVTWAMYGPVTYLPKIMHVIFDMDKMVGGQFEEGLANLKRVSEQ
jgi:uncharacterized protein YndB with AHSA1/START domain